MNRIVAFLTSSDPSLVAEGIRQAEQLFASGNAAIQEVRAIRDALVAIAQSEPFHPHAGGAVWALGKLRDPELRPILVQFLSRAVMRMEAAGGDVWQAIVALADVGEVSLSASGGLRSFDANFERAVQFLRTCCE